MDNRTTNKENNSGSALNTLKEPPMIAAITAIIALGTSVIYFQNRISNLEADLNQTKAYLKNAIHYIETVEKEAKQLKQDIKAHDNNIVQLQEEVRTTKKSQMNGSRGGLEHRAIYTRLTRRERDEEELDDIPNAPTCVDDVAMIEKLED